MKTRVGRGMSSETDKYEDPCYDAGRVRVRQSLDTPSSMKSPTSITDAIDGLKLDEFELTPSPTESEKLKTPLKLVQSCGPDCMIAQRIVDKLLSRMLDLENERSELLAANRSWALQYQFMKEKYEACIKRLEEKLKNVKKANESAIKYESTSSVSSPPPQEPKDTMNLLTHQAEIYKEDFLEERKARVRAHAQIEFLRNELKRERESRSKTSSAIQSPHPSEGPDSVFS